MALRNLANGVPENDAGNGEATPTPPHDLDCEAAVISTCLLSAEHAVIAGGMLHPEDFYAEAHRRIFEAIVALLANNSPVDVVLVATWLRDRGRLSQVGGMAYLTEVLNAAPAVAHVEAYAERVANDSEARRILFIAQQLTAQIYAGLDTKACLNAAVTSLGALAPVAKGAAPSPTTLLEVAARWKGEGPLVHEPTGIVKLDELTGGGPVYGSRWYLLGAPDAGKTALLAQIADEWQARGVVVGILAADEEDGDLTTRFAQRRKFRRDECERRTDDTMREMEDAFAAVDRIFMYGAEWTIEAAAEDLAERAKHLVKDGRAPRMALFIDSIQQVRCNALCVGDSEPSPREVVSANVRAVRAVATRFQLCAVATSEMNRGAYRSVKDAEETNDMAAAKESGAVEYSARVMIAMRSVKDLGDLVEVRVVKNKHGPSWPNVEPFFLSIDRRRMTLASAGAPERDGAASEAKGAARHGAKIDAAAARLAEYLAEHQGEGTRDLRSGLRVAYGPFSNALVDDAIKALGAAVVAPNRSKVGAHCPHWLDGSKVPGEVMARVELNRRPAVAAARPPTETEGGPHASS